MYYSIQLTFRDRVCERILSLDDGNDSFIDISDLTKKKDCVISFEKSGGKLRIKNDGSILVTGDDVIRDGHCNEIEIKGTVLTGALFVSSLDENAVCFERFCPERSFTTGSGNDCDIVIKGDYISRRHAEISCDGGVFSIKDLSENGVFVNGKKIDGKRQLDPFDIIWIFGAKIVFAGDSIAVQKNSNFAGCTLVSAEEGYETEFVRKSGKAGTGSMRSFSVTEKDCEAELELPAASSGVHRKHGVSDIMKTAVPASAVLSAAAAFRGALTVPQTIAAFVAGTAAVTGIWLGAERVSEMASAKRISSDRQDELKKYEGLLAEKQENFRLMMNERFPDAREAAHMFAEGRRRIVPPSDEDFLKVRIGTGKASFERFIKTGGTPDKQLEELVKKYRYADGVPAEADLKSGKVFHVSGKHEAVTEFIRSMAVKISASFDPENVKMMFILPDGDPDGVSFVKWLPHTFSSDRKIRFTGFDDLSAAHMEEIISSLLKRETMNHHLIVFASDDSLLSSSEVKKYLNSDREGKIVFIISRYSDEENLAFSGPEKTVLTDSEDRSEGISPESALSYARLMAGTDTACDGSESLPDTLSFTGMYENSDEDINDISGRWERNRSYESIRALIGTDSSGKPFYLDLHETGHGPHGLIAGTTGSGKSELIQTLILSLALGYSPEQVAFVLIDYKGGGMSRVFEGLPHVAGILTNLSDKRNETGRILVSLSGEIRKRQVIFKKHDVSHIDAYLKLYENGKAEEALPHLVIICDEFAELKKEQPDFISELVSISRVGRSLGIHLLLATQRPSGVVDDEIRSNSGFSICLKVRDRDDSISLLEKPDAAFIETAGRALVRCGNTTGMTLVQTGFSGAQYSPEGKKLSAFMIFYDGTPVNDREDKCEEDGITELAVLTEKTKRFCAKSGIAPARQVWREAPGTLIPSDDIGKYGKVQSDEGLVFAAGVTDDPENQAVFPTVFDLYTTGNILISGIAGSGKTMFLASMISFLAENYPPERIMIKTVDFTAGVISVFGRLRHSAACLSSPDEREFTGLLDEIRDDIERRKRKFSEVHVSDYSEYMEVSDDLCLELVVIDGCGVLKDLYPAAEEQMTRLAGECVRYGIVFVITVNQASDIRLKTRQNYRTVITFEQNDRSEYTDLLGVRPEGNLPFCPGRGLYLSDRRVLSFQGTLCCTGKGREKYSSLLAFCERVNASYGSTAEIKDAFCIKENVSDHAGYIALVNRYSEIGKVLFWSDDDPEAEKAENFKGRAGAYDLLLKLKDIFSERVTARKISGSFDGEDIYVIIEDPDSFCGCIYAEGNEDMALITEKFLKGGSGFGVSFVTGQASGAEKYADSAFIKAFEKGGAVC